MKGRTEALFYLTVGVGMALATSAFTMVSGLFTFAATGWILLGVMLVATALAQRLPLVTNDGDSAPSRSGSRQLQRVG